MIWQQSIGLLELSWQNFLATFQTVESLLFFIRQLNCSSPIFCCQLYAGANCMRSYYFDLKWTTGALCTCNLQCSYTPSIVVQTWLSSSTNHTPRSHIRNEVRNLEAAAEPVGVRVLGPQMNTINVNTAGCPRPLYNWWCVLLFFILFFCFYIVMPQGV